jgi:hypothetical protein
VGSSDVIRRMWNATYVQTGTDVSASSVFHHAIIRPGHTRSFAYFGTHSGPVSAPANFTLNGQPCEVID